VLSGRDATEPKALVAEDASAAVPATLAKVRRDIFLPILLILSFSLIEFNFGKSLVAWLCPKLS
jgi:hypothetical protein